MNFQLLKAVRPPLLRLMIVKLWMSACDHDNALDYSRQRSSGGNTTTGSRVANILNLYIGSPFRSRGLTGQPQVC